MNWGPAVIRVTCPGRRYAAALHCSSRLERVTGCCMACEQSVTGTGLSRQCLRAPITSTRPPHPPTFAVAAGYACATAPKNPARSLRLLTPFMRRGRARKGCKCAVRCCRRSSSKGGSYCSLWLRTTRDTSICNANSSKQSSRSTQHSMYTALQSACLRLTRTSCGMAITRLCRQEVQGKSRCLDWYLRLHSNCQVPGINTERDATCCWVQPVGLSSRVQHASDWVLLSVTRIARVWL